MTTAPGLFLGLRFVNALLEAHTGNTDDAVAFGLLMRSNRLAPAGLAFTATFKTIHITTLHADAQSVTVRLLVDDVVRVTRVIALPSQAEPRQYKFQVNLSEPVMVAGVERLRLHPRGTWAQVEIESDGTAALQVDGLEIEWDPAGRL